MNTPALGLSGLAVYVPPYRIDLQKWCQWRQQDWDKTRAVVGHAFRIRGPEHSVYTMAANAVLRLIDAYQIDPRRIGYLALGTESATDNATGTVIVRGLVDRALRSTGRPPLARDCEVPEIKQACLAGVYGVKGAMRYLALDGEGRQAIVVTSDVAEYARGSTGEPTQGAGAVAMLVERNPRLLALDLAAAGGSSDYRLLDFRKPFARFCGQRPAVIGRVQDFPVFNGKYSTACYLEATLAALAALLDKRGGARAACFRDVEAVFMHRPYHRMPANAWALAYLFALGADGGAAHRELAGYCEAVGVELSAVLAEMASTPALADRAENGELVPEPYPLCALVLKAFRNSAAYRRIVDDKMELGAAGMMEMGNLYTGALPAWIAAGLEEAQQRNRALAGREVLILGYGSGDAAEAIPARVVAGWEEAARRIGFARALDGAVDLDQAQYEALHAGTLDCTLPPAPVSGFVVDRIGDGSRRGCEDYGVEFYRYAGPL